MEYYVIGDDKSLNAVMDILLKLSGGNMTGNIGYKSASRTGDIIRFISGDANGSGISIGDGGAAVIGSGTSARSLQPAAGNGKDKRMIIAGDTTIEFYVNCTAGVNNATKVTMSTAGLLSGHQKAIASGTTPPTGGNNGDIYIQY